MNIKSLREHLAIKVMGWKEFELASEIVYWTNDAGDLCCPVSDWKPDKNIEQAMECLDTFVEAKIYLRKPSFVPVVITKYRCDIWEDKAWRASRLGQGNSDTLMSEAISFACAKATGWKE